MMYRRLTATVAAGGALLLALTGCLGDGGEKATGQRPEGADGADKIPAAQYMAQVSKKTEQTDTYSMRMVTSGEMTEQGQTVKAESEARVQVRLRPEPAMKGTIVIRGTGPGMGGVGSSASADKPVEMIMIGGTIYMKMDLPQGAAGGKPWLKFSTGESMAEALTQSEQYSPSRMAQMLTTAPDVRRAGEETVEGVRTTRYSGTVDANTGLNVLDPKDRRAMEKQLQELGARAMIVDLWVDDQGLPRKQHVKLDMKQGRLEMTAHFSDYGEPVQISAPPADQVGDFDEIFKGLEDIVNGAKPPTAGS